MLLEFLRKGKGQNSLTGIENDTIFKVFHLMGKKPAESLLNRNHLEIGSKGHQNEQTDRNGKNEILVDVGVVVV